ncbi:hypothetical protein RHSIM_RhsimUnG0255600 [Rhododendron simsii]|uniref:Uncharacterized protein n=1 Tax=Rhododendron simsii TaxID=118357 RepID=A0A834L3N6_RHOSS|nr:hypothetical protein RHSIM_RhsimUnG0255600 [Rhododendron simsii]
MEGFVIPLCILSVLVFSILITSNGVDTITTTKSLADGETIVSSGGIFELGFFSPGNSTNRYVIWYKKILPIMTVVWVANRETPLFDKAGVLKLTSPGILVLVNGTNDTIWIWSTKTSRSAQDPVAQLFDSGNMVVRNSDDEIKAENFLWQSFDYPGNTLLPGMKLGKNFLTGQEWYISSWKSDDDPGQGVFTYVLDTHGYPQMFLRNRSTDSYGSGPWNGLKFSGIQNPAPISRFYYDVSFNYDLNTDVVYYTYEVTNSSVVSRSVLSHEGYMTLWASFDQTRSWLTIGSVPKASCDRYASCGSYGICNKNNSPVCGCLVKFVPKNPKEWKLHDWSNGCVRRTPLSCQQEGGEDGFVKYSRVKLPDTRNSSFDRRMSLEECRRTCLGNCSCMAYANLDIREAGSGCLLWFGDLIDIKEFIEGGGQDIYVRMASSESGGNVSSTPKGRNIDRKLIITALAVSMTMLTTAFFYCIWRRKLRKKGKDLLSFDLGTSIGAGNKTLAEASKSQNSRKKEVDLPCGYMSPEYAFKGLFSVKSDVFSFGVLLLEILSGKRNTAFHDSDSLNLLGYAWDLWKNGRGLDLKDPMLEDISSATMLLRYVNIGLLCVQESAADRPTILAFYTTLSFYLETAMEIHAFLSFFHSFSFSSAFLKFSIGSDNLGPNKSLRDGESLVSTSHKIELGFFSPGSSKNRYLGIWYVKNPETVVWVANRNNPINDSKGVLTISSNKTLALFNGNHSINWSSNSSSVVARSKPFAKLLDSGNFLLIDAAKPDSNTYLWLSFDYPSDTWLPGMKLGQNLNTGLDQHLTSWRTAEDLSLGKFTYGIENHGFPQLSHQSSRSTHIGVQREQLISLFSPNKSFVKRSILSQSGFLQHYSLNGKSNTWELMYTAPNDLCDNYGHCGPNGFCRMKRTSCECLKGFTPKSQQEWEVLNWSNGCVHSVPLDCQKGEGFVKVAHFKLPDLLEIQLNTGMGFKECKHECLKNCSCIAYANSNICKHECLKNCSCIAYANSNISEGGSGCLMWLGDLIDTREFFQEGSEQDIYIHLPASAMSKIDQQFKEEEKTHEDLTVISHFSNVNLGLEYAIDGQFSVKSGAFSFGVLSLEIVSGKGNRGFHHPDHHHKLLGHAWLLWNEERSLELKDSSFKDSCVKSQVQRCIQVGLLCIQKRLEDRPSMSTVVFMLGNDEAKLPQPQQPGFFTGSIDKDNESRTGEFHTIDVATITILEAR